MQTPHLRFRDLRAISLRQGLSRWRTPSDAMRAGMGAAFALPNPPEPTCAVGWRPASRHPDDIPCPVAGAELPGVSHLRAARKNSRVPVLSCRVCRWQTASDLPPYPAPHEAGDLGADHWQARASAVRCTPSGGLSFPLRPAHHKAGASGEKTVAHLSDGSGTRCSEAPGFRPTGRLKPAPSTRVTEQATPSSCADSLALVTGQVPDGMGMPSVSVRPRSRLRHGLR